MPKLAPPPLKLPKGGNVSLHSGKRFQVRLITPLKHPRSRAEVRTAI